VYKTLFVQTNTIGVKLVILVDKVLNMDICLTHTHGFASEGPY